MQNLRRLGCFLLVHFGVVLVVVLVVVVVVVVCDRGKTKSTPSPKTEVWTLVWSLKKIIYF